MQYLMTEEYEKAIEYRQEHKSGMADFDNITRLEKIQEIWENVILHRKLKISAGKIEVLFQTITPGSINPTYFDSVSSLKAQNEPFHLWVTVDKKQIFEHYGDASCSLYNKIFGA